MNNPSSQDLKDQNQSENEQMHDDQVVELVKQNAAQRTEKRQASGERNSSSTKADAADSRVQRNLRQALSKERERE